MNYKACIATTMVMLILSIFGSALTTEAANGRYGTYYSDPFYYEIENGCATITDFNAFSAYVPIPNLIDGYSVTKIADKAFYGWFNESTTTEIPEGVQIIEDRAFLGVIGRGFNDVIIPKSVIEIGEYAIGFTDYAESGTFSDVEEVIGELENVIIRGYAGTAAETYANENGFTFIALDDVITTTITDTSTETQTTSSTTAAVVSSLCGDVNLDGKVDLCDVILLEKYAVKSVELNEQQQKNGDCNADGITDSNDSLCLMRFLIRIIDSLPESNLL